jgi:hypothetical protein
MAKMGDTRYPYRILVGNSFENDHLEKKDKMIGG